MNKITSQSLTAEIMRYHEDTGLESFYSFEQKVENLLHDRLLELNPPMIFLRKGLERKYRAVDKKDRRIPGIELMDERHCRRLAEALGREARFITRKIKEEKPELVKIKKRRPPSRRKAQNDLVSAFYKRLDDVTKSCLNR